MSYLSTAPARAAACLKLSLIPLSLLLAACGSSGGGDNGAAVNGAAVSGVVFAAPVSGASVEVQDTGGNTVAGPVTSGSDGRYSLRIPAAHRNSALVIMATGGNFGDEATGQSATAGTLSTYLPAGSLSGGSASRSVTPGTTIVRDMVMMHGMTFSAAQSAFESAFGYVADPSVQPVDVTDSANATAAAARRLAGLRAAAFSQLAMDLRLNASEQFDLLSALADDLADGSLDGEANGGTLTVGSVAIPADIRNRFTLALHTFHDGGNDHSGLENDELGVPPFAKLALSKSYRVEYIAGGMMGEQVGENTFTLRISADGTPASKLMVSLMPMMHMAGMMHATPNEGCSESATTAGDYTCTIYYLMASEMNGMSMGYWQVKAMIGGMIGGMMGESVSFFPTVMMAMGDTALAKLKGVSDEIPDMMGMAESRTYYLFNDGADADSLSLFIAARESMMSFPALYVGQTFNSGTADELSVTSVDVEVSSDDGASWTAASDDGNGHWSISGLGLTAGQANALRVRLTVNREIKTSNGTDTGTDYATFTVSP